jgi:hypothetical protein
MAAWIIGQPSESALVLPGFMKICNDDAISIVSQLPPELVEHVPEVRELREKVKELEAKIGELEAAPTSSSLAGEISGKSMLPARLPCPYCDMTFVNQGSLANHINHKHPGKAGG